MASVSNPKVYTIDTYDYQFRWDSCNDVKKQYELYIYSDGNILNLAHPIIITYNQKIPIHLIERACAAPSPFENVQFKIKDLTIIEENASLEEIQTQIQTELNSISLFPTTPNFYIGACVTDITAVGDVTETKDFNVVCSNKCRDYFDTYYKDDVLFDLMDEGYYTDNCKIEKIRKAGGFTHRIYFTDFSKQYAYIYFTSTDINLKNIQVLNGWASKSYDVKLQKCIDMTVPGGEIRKTWVDICFLNQAKVEKMWPGIEGHAEKVRICIRMYDQHDGHLAHEGTTKIEYIPKEEQLFNILNYDFWYCKNIANSEWEKYSQPLGLTTSVNEVQILREEGFELSTDYIGYLSYTRSNDKIGPVGIRMDVESITYIQDEMFTLKSIPENWNTPYPSMHGEIHDISLVDKIYIPYYWKSGTETWTVKLGNRIEGAHNAGVHVVDDGSVPVISLTMEPGVTYDVSNYIYLEARVETTRSQPSEPIDDNWYLQANLHSYKKPETHNDINYIRNKIEFSTGDSYYTPVNNDCFKGLNSFKIIDYVSSPAMYLYQFTKYQNNTNNEVYIYQKTKNNTYRLCNNLSNPDQITSDGSVLDPEVEQPSGYNLPNGDFELICLGSPILDANFEIKTSDISINEIEGMKKLYEGFYDKLDIYKLLSINDFEDNFNWEVLEIKRHSPTNISSLYVKGVRNDEQLINLTNKYTFTIENNIVEKEGFSKTFNLEYKNDDEVWSGKWCLKDNGSFITDSGWSLNSLEQNELGKRTDYTVIVKAFSVNNKRSKVIYKQEINNKYFTNFFQVPKYLNSSEKDKSISFYLSIENPNEEKELSLKNINYMLLHNISSYKGDITFNFYIKRDNQYILTQQQTINSETNSFLAINTENFDLLKYTATQVNELRTSLIFNKANIDHMLNRNFSLAIEKNDIFSNEQAYPWALYNNSLNPNIFYLNYIKRPQTQNLVQYDYGICENINKVNMYVQPPMNTAQNEGDVLTIDFKITEMEKQNSSHIIITSSNNELFTRNSTTSSNTSFTYVNNTDEDEIVYLSFPDVQKTTEVLGILNLQASGESIEIYNTLAPSNHFYKITTSFSENILLNDRLFGNCKDGKIAIKIKNGTLSSDNLQYTYLTKVNADRARNRKFYTDNIKIYSKQSTRILNYQNIENGSIITGQVLDKGLPVNLYIKNFSDLNETDPGSGDLIYKIEKIKTTYQPPLEIINDINKVILTQNGKTPFKKEFLINPDTNVLTIKNTNTKRIEFLEPQKNTIINCVLEKERS